MIEDCSRQPAIEIAEVYCKEITPRAFDSHKRVMNCELLIEYLFQFVMNFAVTSNLC